MGNSVLTNVSAQRARTNLEANTTRAASAIAKLSSGLRISKASDDAASNAVAKQLGANIAALIQASSNASQGSSLIEVANGALSLQGDMLSRMKVLATQSNNGALGADQRAYLQREFENLVEQIDDIATQTRFNGASLLTGGAGTGTTATASVAAAITGATLTNFGTTTATTMAGMVLGSAVSASVTKVGSTFTLSATIGDQTYVGSASGGAGQIAFVMVSTTNPANRITLTSEAGAVLAADTAAAIETKLKGYLGIGGAEARFTSASGDGDANGTTIASTSVGASTSAGVYYLSYVTATATTGTLTLSDQKGNRWTSDVTGATDLSHSFSNGVSITLGANGTGATQFDLATSLATPLRINVTEGTGISMDFQVGGQSTDVVTLDFTPATAAALNLTGLTVATPASAAIASDAIDLAISTVVTQQADLGAIQSRFNFVGFNLATLIENSSAVKSTFYDADMAQEQINYTTYSVLADAAISMLAQANMQPQKLAKLLQ